MGDFTWMSDVIIIKKIRLNTVCAASKGKRLEINRNVTFCDLVMIG